VVALIALLVFLVIAGLVFAIGYGLDSRNARARLLRERLDSLEQATRRGPTEELQLLRDELLSEIPALNRLLEGSSRIARLQNLLSQAGISMRPGKFVLIVACAGTFGTLGFDWLTRSILFGLLLGAGCALAPIVYALYLRSRRFSRFEQLFPEAIDLLGRAVRAGHAFTTALEMIGTETSEPLAGEFRTLHEEQKFGLPVREALLNLAERVPLVDVKFFVTAVMLQRETGGNLAEILDKLSYVIRERFKIQRQVKIFTAQGRMTLAILMTLPPGLALLMLFTNHDFMAPLFTDPIGHFLVFTGVVMQTIGFLIIRKIIHIRV